MSKEQGNAVIRESLEKRGIKDAYRKVFLGSDEGKLVLTDLLQSCGVLRRTFVVGDPEQSAYNAGKEEIGIAIIDMLDKRGYEAIIELERYGAKLTELGEDFDHEDD